MTLTYSRDLLHGKLFEALEILMKHSVECLKYPLKQSVTPVNKEKTKRQNPQNLAKKRLDTQSSIAYDVPLLYFMNY